jgi:isoleucyl-tRNA synthetase
VYLRADEVEFVGHVLDAEGATFSKTKFDNVVELKKTVKHEGAKVVRGIGQLF